MPNQRKESAVSFLLSATAYFARLGVRVERVMTDSGSCYQSKTFRAACRQIGLRQIFTKPYTPKTNGKAERGAVTLPYEERERSTLTAFQAAATASRHVVIAAARNTR